MSVLLRQAGGIQRLFERVVAVELNDEAVFELHDVCEEGQLDLRTALLALRLESHDRHDFVTSALVAPQDRPSTLISKYSF